MKLKALMDYWSLVQPTRYCLNQKALAITLKISAQKLSSYMLVKEDGKESEPGMYILLPIAKHYDIDAQYFHPDEQRPVAEFYTPDDLINKLAKMLAEFSSKDLEIISMLAMGWKQQKIQVKDEFKLGKRADFPEFLY
ncbi:MAG: hypothetical protein ACOYXT_29135 [Bacteroidota bacterium]